MVARKYYWLKLRDSFFDDKKIKKLRSIAGGDTFTIIYLKMMLRSLQTDGVFSYDGLEDTFYKELALELDEDPTNVQITVDFLLKVGLLEEIGEEFHLPEVSVAIGSEGGSAERMRRLRQRRSAAEIEEKASLCDAHVTASDVSDAHGVVEIEKRRDREEIEKIREDRTPHGEFQNVLLSESEVNRLRACVGDAKADEAIRYLDEWIEEDPKRKKEYKKKKHYLCIRRWVLSALDEREKRSGAVNKTDKYSTASKMKPLEAFWEKKRREIGDDSQ